MNLLNNANAEDSKALIVLEKLRNISCIEQLGGGCKAPVPDKPPLPETNDKNNTQRKKRTAQGPPDPASSAPMGDPTSTILAEYEFLSLYMLLNETIRLSIGHQYKDFLLSCTFRGVDCLNQT